jgi:hypothetical protein
MLMPVSGERASHALPNSTGLIDDTNDIKQLTSDTISVCISGSDPDARFEASLCVLLDHPSRRDGARARRPAPSLAHLRLALLDFRYKSMGGPKLIAASSTSLAFAHHWPDYRGALILAV